MIVEPRKEDPTRQETWPRFYDAAIVEDGQVLVVELREFDGTHSVVRINVSAVAD